MTDSILTQSKPPLDVARALRLSIIAGAVGRLLREAQELQGGGLLEDHRHTGEVMVRLMAPGATDAAAKAATRFAEQLINSAVEAVAPIWEEYQHGGLIRHALEEMAREFHKSAEIIPIVYMRALREPERYCACGTELDTTLSAERGRCDACWIRGAVTEGRV
jgi:hypothetical protein